jgi:hypothetical protein
MSATASISSAGQTPSASWRSAAVVRGIGLIGVVKGFARGVLGLGMVMNGAIARLKHEGADPYSANAGFDFKAVLHLLQRAVLMADALRARLRTPAVGMALARFSLGRASARYAPPRPAAQPEADDQLSHIACARKDERLRRQLRKAIEDMSDCEVLTRIYGDLLQASAMLGETDVAQEVRALACKASALLGDEAAEVPGVVAIRDGAPADGARSDVAPQDGTPDAAAKRPSAHGNPGDSPGPNRVPGGRPPPREVGRGPPQGVIRSSGIRAVLPLPLAGEGGRRSACDRAGSRLLFGAQPHALDERRPGPGRRPLLFSTYLTKVRQWTSARFIRSVVSTVPSPSALACWKMATCGVAAR